jgi:hypothetical protein
MNTRMRLVVLVLVLLAALGGGFGYVLLARQRQAQQAARPPAQPTGGALAAISAAPHLVFRNTALGAGYGHVAMVPLAEPGGPRAITPAQCDRVYAAAGSAICLRARRGLVTSYLAELLGPDWLPRRELPLTGLPSRARLAPDGSLSATTVFVYGDSYNSPGQFSTRTVISPVAGTGAGTDVESFELRIDGRVVTAADRNVWGVTFADDDRFYATAATGGHTYLVQGSLAGHRLTALRRDVECPDLSPDHTRVAYKKHGDLPPGHWRLAVLDLRSGRETPLAEVRSVDDQAEWLDNDRVVYGLPRDSAGTASSDIWVVPADGTGAARILVPDAWSPAVVRCAGPHPHQLSAIPPDRICVPS